MPDKLYQHYLDMQNDLRRAERAMLAEVEPNAPFIQVLENVSRFERIRCHAKHSFHVYAGVAQ